MAPQQSIDQSAHPSASPSSSSEVITNSLFGVCALVIGIITIRQGKKLRAIWSHAFQDHGLQFEGSTIAYELDDTRIESSIGPDGSLQAFTASNDAENETYAPPGDPSVESSPRTSGVQPDGQIDVIIALGPEACVTPSHDDGPTASECRDGRLTVRTSPSLSGARPVPPGVQMFDSTVAM